MKNKARRTKRIQETSLKQLRKKKREKAMKCYEEQRKNNTKQETRKIKNTKE